MSELKVATTMNMRYRVELSRCWFVCLSVRRNTIEKLKKVIKYLTTTRKAGLHVRERLQELSPLIKHGSGLWALVPDSLGSSTLVGLTKVVNIY